MKTGAGCGLTGSLSVIVGNGGAGTSTTGAGEGVGTATGGGLISPITGMIAGAGIIGAPAIGTSATFGTGIGIGGSWYTTRAT